MLDHLTLTVRDIDRSIAFYTKALAPLGYIAKAHHEPTIGFGVNDGTPHSDFYVSPMDKPTATTQSDESVVSTQDAAIPAPACPITHIAFLADSPATVRAFYTAALAAGGRDNGAPGPRAYHPGYYAAFILDPDGNNIEAVTNWCGWPDALRQPQSHDAVPDEASSTRSMVANDKASNPKRHIADMQDELGCRAPATMNAPLPNRSAQDIRQTISDPSKQGDIGIGHITAHSSPACKVRLFRSLFRGRDDVYAHGFVSKKTGKIGYAPAAWNEWTQLADGRRIPTPPGQRQCKPLTDQVLLDHFTKRDDRFTNVVGLYPMSKDSKVWFLAIDFDDEGWMREISAVRRVCEQHGLQPAVERSRSGDGGHLWLFFAEQIDAAQARRMGSVLLTQASNLTHIMFRSYDRMFPNQDTIPAGGFGNLIALPLQRKARDNGNSIFVDGQFKPYEDQWSFLSSIQRVTSEQISAIVALASQFNGPLGKLISPTAETAAGTSNVASIVGATTTRMDKLEGHGKSGAPRTGHPQPRNTITSSDVPDSIDIIERNMLVIPKTDMTATALNAIRRLAAFANPDFYRAQAMRQPVYNKPRIIYRGEETEGTILLPRGCKEPLDILAFFRRSSRRLFRQTQRGDPHSRKVHRRASAAAVCCGPIPACARQWHTRGADRLRQNRHRRQSHRRTQNQHTDRTTLIRVAEPVERATRAIPRHRYDVAAEADQNRSRQP